MIKLYKLNQNKNYASFVLGSKVRVKYIFVNGSVVTGTSPTLTLTNKYAQDLLEESNLFKTNTVILVSTQKEEADNADETASTEKAKVIDGVSSVSDAIDYIAENYGEVVKTDSAVKRFCKKHNITFSGLE